MQLNQFTSSLFLLIGSVVFNVVVASDLDDAVEAMRSGNFAEAYCIMRPLAEDGDADAQYNIGWMYLNGYGLRVNDNLALKWWEQASEQGHNDASFSIGMLYSLGDGNVPKNNNKAIDYYLLAAIEGQEDAITILQSMMLRNDRVISSRMAGIIDEHGSLFGIKRVVKARKLNARNGPSTDDKIVTRLLKGQPVIEMYKDGKWSQIAILENEGLSDKAKQKLILNKTVWIYNPLLESIAD